MSDTHIYIKYRNLDKDKEEGEMITCDRGVYKSYVDLYNDNLVGKRLNNCSLIARHHHCLPFLNDIISWWNSENSGWQSEYANNEKLIEYIKKQQIIEVDFDMY